MPGNNDETEPTGHGYPCATCDVAAYDDGNGTDDGANRNADFENGDSSWTYDRYSSSGNSSASVSSSMSSSDSDSGSGLATDDGDGGSDGSSAADDDVQDAAANKNKKKKSAAAISDSNDGYKWIKALCSIVVQNGSEGKQERDKRSSKPVKSILRPPTKYQYVIGMSGFPSKVPVYPRWT
ncbi:Hypothetical protein CINCED_3A011520 [Cinara cedri]|uniref:Uncharacterized protein n=1 Tax=Cinara cedri TaxID=506608 RepID=A0A5E4MQ16_9HEMI|nr:Hypothetical protein CINCED_3A011520 [Cinara cedri]